MVFSHFSASHTNALHPIRIQTRLEIYWCVRIQFIFHHMEMLGVLSSSVKCWSLVPLDYGKYNIKMQHITSRMSQVYWRTTLGCCIGRKTIVNRVGKPRITSQRTPRTEALALMKADHVQGSYWSCHGPRSSWARLSNPSIRPNAHIEDRV